MASKKFLQTTKRETFIIIGLYLLFFFWWYMTAYGFGDDPSQYRYVFGFPEWFFTAVSRAMWEYLLSCGS